MKNSKAAELEAQLAIDEYDLDKALVRQPQLYFMVASEVAMAISKRDAAKQNLTENEAQADSIIRRKATEKLTEPEIKARVQLDKNVVEARDEYLELNLAVARWQALERSFDQRMSALKKLVDLYLKNYYVESGLGPSSAAMKNSDADTARKAMQRMRSK
jgi:hypothetical protein